jgi:hypothetical protein
MHSSGVHQATSDMNALAADGDVADGDLRMTYEKLP